MPTQVDLPARQTFAYKFAVQRFEEFWSFHIERFQRWQTHFGEIRFPTERRTQSNQLLNRHLVVELRRIPPFHAGKRSLGKNRFNADDRLGLDCGYSWLVAKQLEHFLQMGNVLF